MTRVGSRALLLSCAFIALVVAGSAALISYDSAGVRGIILGVGLGIVNLAVSLPITRRSLHKSGKSAQQSMNQVMTMIFGGFGVRLVVLGALVLLFRNSSTVDAAAFGLSFIVLFFVYVAAEVLMVERARTARPA